MKVGNLPESLPALRTRVLRFDDLNDLLRQIREQGMVVRDSGDSGDSVAESLRMIHVAEAIGAHGVRSR